jgi:hypothetical protein
MTTFLFWNLNKRPLAGLVAELAELHQIDVLILAECEIPAHTILRALNSDPIPRFHPTDSECEKIVIYTRFSGELIQKKFESNRLTVRRLMLPGTEEILLAAVHQPDKLHWSNESQGFECVELASTICAVEEEVGHQRTVLVGDFNMNPFEPGLVAANALNAVMSRSVAGGDSRQVQGKDYTFFYNPMLGHFGDAVDGPSGTFYYRSAEHVAYFWHMFDQVLIRPALLSIFKNDGLKILSGGISSFMTASGLPDNSVASDHLPILFRLEM